MKRFNVLLALGLILAMLLVACDVGNNEANNGFNGTDMDFGTDDAFDDGTLEPDAGLATETMEPELPEETDMPEATEPVEATATVEATEEDDDETGMIPVTGYVDPNRLSNLLNFDIWSSQPDNGDTMDDDNNTNNNDNSEDLDNGDDYEQVGSTDDIILDMETMQIQYVLVDVGGFLGIGGKRVAIPYDRVEIVTADKDDDMNGTDDTDDTNDTGNTNDTDDTDDAGDTNQYDFENAFIINVSEEELDQAPEFNDDMLGNFGRAEDGWDSDIETFWETGELDTTDDQVDATETPETTEDTDTDETMTETEMQGSILASELIGKNVRDAGENELAEVEDVIVNHETGEVLYLVLDITGLEDLDGQWMLVPPNQFYVDSSSGVLGREYFLVTSVDVETLRGAPVFEADNLPDTTETGWDADIDTYWNGQ